MCGQIVQHFEAAASTRSRCTSALDHSHKFNRLRRYWPSFTTRIQVKLNWTSVPQLMAIENVVDKLAHTRGSSDMSETDEWNQQLRQGVIRVN